MAFIFQGSEDDVFPEQVFFHGIRPGYNFHSRTMEQIDRRSCNSKLYQASYGCLTGVRFGHTPGHDVHCGMLAWGSGTRTCIVSTRQLGTNEPLKTILVGIEITRQQNEMAETYKDF